MGHTLRDKLTAQGDFYLSTTAFQGRRYLRLTFMHPQTTLAEVERLIGEIRRLKSGKTK